MRTMNFKKVAGLLMKIELFISYYFLKKAGMCLSWPQIFETRFAPEIKYYKTSLNTSAGN